MKAEPMGSQLSGFTETGGAPLDAVVDSRPTASDLMAATPVRRPLLRSAQAEPAPRPRVVLDSPRAWHAACDNPRCRTCRATGLPPRTQAVVQAARVPSSGLKLSSLPGAAPPAPGSSVHSGCGRPGCPHCQRTAAAPKTDCACARTAGQT